MDAAKSLGFVCERFPFATGVKECALHLGWDGKKDLRGRTLLQDIGRVGRLYDENNWVNKTLNTIEDSPHYPFGLVVIDDWRFPNEANFFDSFPLYEVVKVRIESPEREVLKGTAEYWDSSETSLPDGYSSLYDYTIINSGDMNLFKEQALACLDNIINDKEEIIVWTV
jgi:hypothetical protein